MSRLIFSLSWIFLTIIPILCLTLDQPQLAEESSGLEPAVIKPYISDYKEISKEFLGHLLPFQSWFLKSRLQRPAGYARPAYIKSHDQLNNREKWMDYFKANPIGKLYNFYHEAQEVGLDVSKFSLFDYGDHPYEHRPNAVAYKQSLDYEDIE